VYSQITILRYLVIRQTVKQLVNFRDNHRSSQLCWWVFDAWHTDTRHDSGVILRHQRQFPSPSCRGMLTQLRNVINLSTVVGGISPVEIHRLGITSVQDFLKRIFAFCLNRCLQQVSLQYGNV